MAGRLPRVGAAHARHRVRGHGPPAPPRWDLRRAAPVDAEQRGGAARVLRGLQSGWRRVPAAGAVDRVHRRGRGVRGGGGRGRVLARAAPGRAAAPHTVGPRRPGREPSRGPGARRRDPRGRARDDLPRGTRPVGRRAGGARARRRRRRPERPDRAVGGKPLRLLQGLHAHGVPRRPVPRADPRADVPLSPDDLRRARRRQADVRTGGTGAAPAAIAHRRRRHVGRARGTSLRRSARPIGPCRDPGPAPVARPRARRRARRWPSPPAGTRPPPTRSTLRDPRPSASPASGGSRSASPRPSTSSSAGSWSSVRSERAVASSTTTRAGGSRS